MQKIPGKKIFVILTEEQLSSLERVQKRHHLSRSEAIRNMLDLGLDVYSDFEKAGIPQFVEIGKRLKGAVRDALQPKLA